MNAPRQRESRAVGRNIALFFFIMSLLAHLLISYTEDTIIADYLFSLIGFAGGVASLLKAIVASFIFGCVIFFTYEGLFSINKDVNYDFDYNASKQAKETESRTRIEEEMKRLKDNTTNANLLDSAYFQKKWELPPVIAKELLQITDYVIRDFIDNWWEKSIGTDRAFPNDVRKLVSDALGNLVKRLRAINVLLFFVQDIPETLRLHLNWYREMRLRAATKNPEKFGLNHVKEGSKMVYTMEEGKDDETVAMREKLIVEEFELAGLLHPAAKPVTAEELSYLRHVSNEVVRNLLSEQDFNCPVVRHIFREIFACNILAGIMSMFCPDYLNYWILLGITGSDSKDNLVPQNEKDSEGKKENEVEPAATAAANPKEGKVTVNNNYPAIPEDIFPINFPKELENESGEFPKFGFNTKSIFNKNVNAKEAAEILRDRDPGSFVLHGKSTSELNLSFMGQDLKVWHLEIQFDTVTNLYSTSYRVRSSSQTPLHLLFKIRDVVNSAHFLDKSKDESELVSIDMPWKKDLIAKTILRDTENLFEGRRRVEINPHTLESEQRQLILQLQGALFDLIPSFVNDPDCTSVLDTQPSLQRFIISFEAVLRHELVEDAEQDYWYLLKHLFESSVPIDTLNIGDRRWRGRAVLYTALNHKVLAIYMEALAGRIPLLEKLYYPSALIRNIDQMKIFLDLLAALNGVDFSLNLDKYVGLLDSERYATFIKLFDNTIAGIGLDGMPYEDEDFEIMNEGGVGPEENSQSNDIIPSSSSVSLSKKVEIAPLELTPLELEEKEREILFIQLEDSMKEVIMSFVAKPEKPIMETFQSLQRFVISFEAILRHGLNEDAEQDYWILLKHIFDPVPNDELNLGVPRWRGKIILYTALNQRFLATALEFLLSTKDLIQKLYLPHSILHSDKMKTVFSLLAGLHGVDFNLKIDKLVGSSTQESFKNLLKIFNKTSIDVHIDVAMLKKSAESDKIVLVDEETKVTKNHTRLSSEIPPAVTRLKVHIPSKSEIPPDLENFSPSVIRKRSPAVKFVPNSESSKTEAGTELTNASNKMGLRAAIGPMTDLFSDSRSSTPASSSSGFASGTLIKPITMRMNTSSPPVEGKRKSVDKWNAPNPVILSPTPLRSPVPLDKINARRSPESDLRSASPDAFSNRTQSPPLGSSEEDSPLNFSVVNDEQTSIGFTKADVERINRSQSPDIDGIIQSSKNLLSPASKVEKKPTNENRGGYKVNIIDYKLKEPDNSPLSANGNTGDKQPFYLYVIDVSQGGFKWTIMRRYNVFYWLNISLKSQERYGNTMKGIDFPKKSFWGTYDKAFIETRRAQLDRWLKNLVNNPRIGNSDELRSFLAEDNLSLVGSKNDGRKSPSQIKREEKSGDVPSGKRRRSSAFENSRNRAGTALYDNRRVEVENVQRNTVTRRLSKLGLENPYQGPSRDRTDTVSAASLVVNGQEKSQSTKIDAGEMERVEHHVYLLVRELFELDDGSWLRRNLLSVTRAIIRFGFEGTLSRLMQDTYLKLSSAEIVASTITWITETIWPKGVFFTPAPLRTLQEQENTKRDVKLTISKMIPSAIISLVGARNAKYCNIKLFEFIQSPTMVRNLFYTVIDLLLLKIFPKIKVYSKSIASLNETSK